MPSSSAGAARLGRACRHRRCSAAADPATTAAAAAQEGPSAATAAASPAAPSTPTAAADSNRHRQQQHNGTAPAAETWEGGTGTGTGDDEGDWQGIKPRTWRDIDWGEAALHCGGDAGRMHHAGRGGALRVHAYACGTALPTDLLPMHPTRTPTHTQG
jgi:hypothetical protein